MSHKCSIRFHSDITGKNGESATMLVRYLVLFVHMIYVKHFTGYHYISSMQLAWMKVENRERVLLGLLL